VPDVILSCVSGLRALLRRALVPMLALVTAFVLGAVLIVATDVDHLQHLGTDPVGAIGGAIGALVDGYVALFSGMTSDPGRIAAAIQSGNAADIAKAIRPLTETLLGAAPFIFAGLGVAVSFRAGLFNLGVDGQFLIGGLGATVTAILLDGQLPPFAILLVAIVGGTLSGAAYGFVPGLLKARTGAHEVITTLMLNTIAAQIALYVLRSGDFSRPLTPIADVPKIFDLPTIRLDWGFVVALVMSAVVSFVLFRTTLGFEIRASGFSRTVARGTGMRPGRITIVAMSISGGLVGMASAFVALGPVGGLGAPPSREFGFVVLALALIGGLKPSGVALSALLYGALDNGAQKMVIVSGIPFALLVVIIAFAMMLVAAPSLIRTIWRLRPPEPSARPPIMPPGPPDPVIGA
jgi:general nucleoside transport system permease protein